MRLEDRISLAAGYLRIHLGPKLFAEHVRLERAVVEAMAITGRSEATIRRGFCRIQKIAQNSATREHFWNLQQEWRRRVIMGQWGQRGRLQRLGIAV